jgi:recombination protein RecA
MDFMKEVTKELEKAGIQVGASQPPRYWFSTGNYVLNKTISGSFYDGVPQGRVLAYVGPASSGKSFLICNALREAQAEGAYVVVLDSENALDDDFVSKIGVDPNNNYFYADIDTIPQCKKVASKIISKYKAEYGNGNVDAPKMVIAIDSLDMLMTETESAHFDKGVSKGDQGQRNKQLKAMLRELVQAIKRENISILVTSHVYRNQDIMNGEGVWIVSDAIRYSLSQICLLTKLKLKDKNDNRVVEGIRMKGEGYKTRFTKPYQSVTIEVPYNTGMDPFNGLLDVAVLMGVCERRGAWYSHGEDKFRRDDFAEVVGVTALAECQQRRERHNLEAIMEGEELDLTAGPSLKKKRQTKATAK